jgi:hypothetical protein
MLPEWADPEKAMHRLERILYQRQMTEEANAALTGKGEVCHLPGFTIFDRGDVVAPYDWCVPKPRHDEADVLNAYEEYVDRNLGLVPNPGLVAYQAIGRGSGRKYFGPKRSPGRWYTPLLKLIAVGQHSAHETATVRGSRVELDLGGFRMVATPRGAWSNFRNKTIEAKRPAVDSDFFEVTVQPIKTAHPLASYLSGRVEDDVLWLANVAIQGERFKLIPELHFRPPAAKPTPKRRRALAVDVLGAGLTCQELLEGPPQGLLLSLYQAAVPVLMTSRYFKSHFGNPYGPHGDRFIAPETRVKMAERIREIVEDLQAK